MGRISYGSVCSGIEAATMAWHVLGWRPAFFSEIEPFPCAVLSHHYPNVPNLGDMTKFKDWPDDAIDLLVGGTPCQSFSVAGLRAGLADPRGNLMLTYLAVAAKYRPRWLVWENVPGVLSSNGGRDFGAFLGGLGELGYGFAYRVLDAQFVRVGGFPRAVPQRRRRVFVVGHLGDWRRAAAVLFDAASLRGDSAPRREAGQGVAGTISASLRGGGGTNSDNDGGLIASTGNVAHCLNAGGMGRQDYETETMVAVAGTLGRRTTDHPNGMKSEADFLVAHALRADGFDASEDETGRGTPVIPIDMRQASRGATMTNNRAEGSSGGAPGTGIGNVGDPAPTLADSHTPAIAFDARQSDVIQYGNKAGPLDTDAFSQAVQTGWAVRRLTPRECERLQGFPDDFTAVPYRGKPAADGPRYKALGNSMAVNCMRWLGERIAMVDAMQEERAAA